MRGMMHKAGKGTAHGQAKPPTNSRGFIFLSLTIIVKLLDVDSNLTFLWPCGLDVTSRSSPAFQSVRPSKQPEPVVFASPLDEMNRRCRQAGRDGVSSVPFGRSTNTVDSCAEDLEATCVRQTSREQAKRCRFRRYLSARHLLRNLPPSMPRNTRAPPLVTEGVFTASASSLINATREEVWNVVLDFNSYPQWYSSRYLFISSSP
jgi:hypothetical protein